MHSAFQETQGQRQHGGCCSGGPARNASQGQAQDTAVNEKQKFKFKSPQDIN